MRICLLFCALVLVSVQPAAGAHGSNPFAGRKLRCRAVRTVVGGRTAWEGGR